MGILQELPDEKELLKILAGEERFDSLNIDIFQGCDTEKFVNSILTEIPKELLGELPPLEVSSTLSPKEFTGNLVRAMDNIKAVPISSRLKRILEETRGGDQGIKDIDLRKPGEEIGAKLTAFERVNRVLAKDIPGFKEISDRFPEGQNFLQEAKQRPLTMTVGEQEKWKQILADGLNLCYRHRFQNFQNRIPGYFLSRGVNLFSSEEGKTSFWQFYGETLERMEAKGEGPDPELLYQELLPGLRMVTDAQNTLVALASGKLEALDLSEVKQERVFLQACFDHLSTALLGSFQLADEALTGEETFLKELPDRSGAVVDTLETGMTNAMTEINNYLQGLLDQVERAEGTLSAFMKKPELEALIIKIKNWCNGVAASQKKTEMKKLKIQVQLQKNFEMLEQWVQKQFAPGLSNIVTEIVTLLDRLQTGLEDENLISVIQECLDSVEQLVMDMDKTLPLADQTKNITKINALEKTVRGLESKKIIREKVGHKLLRELKFTERLKPEQLDLFHQLAVPLKQDIDNSEDALSRLKKRVEFFKPDHLIENYILDSEAYQKIISELKGGQLEEQLAPLQNVSKRLSHFESELEPKALMKKLQEFYEKIKETTSLLSRNSLSERVDAELYTVREHLIMERDVELESLLNTAKLEMSQILQDREEFGSLMATILEGKCFIGLQLVLMKMENELTGGGSGPDLSKAMADLKTITGDMQQQVEIAPEILRGEMENLAKILNEAPIGELEKKRKNLVKKYAGSPELNTILKELDLSCFLDMKKTLSKLVRGKKTEFRQRIYEQLKGEVDAFSRITEYQLKAGLPALFKRQLQEPLVALIELVLTQMQPLRKRARSIPKTIKSLRQMINNDLVRAAGTLGERIDRQWEILRVFSNGFRSRLDQSQGRLDVLVGAFEPTRLLNSFEARDFAGFEKSDCPEGMTALAQLILKPDADTPVHYLHKKLTDAELDVLKKQPLDSLSPEAQDIVLRVFNEALGDPYLGNTKDMNAIKTELGKWPQRREADILLKLISAARGEVENSQGPSLIRFNRLLLEIFYRNNIKLSLQSIHPILQEMMTDADDDDTEQGAVCRSLADKIKELPDQLIREPLATRYQKVEEVAQLRFDRMGVFKLFAEKLEAKEQKLERGLDELTLAYKNLAVLVDRKLLT